MDQITRLVRGIGVADDDACKPTVEAVPSPLEVAQAAWRPTSSQLAGARAAAMEQKKRAEVAETKRISKPVGRVWSSFGGDVIEGSMLEHVDLVDARWLISLHTNGGVVPRWQDVPSAARIDRTNVWRLYAWERMFSLGILVLSYPWLDGEHPDRFGEQLGRLVPILQQMLPFCGGDEFTVGVLWDYCSLPQPSRTTEEADRFELGVASLLKWYAHPYTHVLLMTGDLPTGAAYSNARPYHARGWCEVERRISAVSTCAHCCWDLSGFDPRALEGLGGMVAFDELRTMLRAGRPPPMAPNLFAKHLREGVSAGRLGFSSAADCERVIHMYRDGFVSVFERYREFDPDGFFAAFAAMEWREAEANQVASALAYAAKHCKPPAAASRPARESGGRGKGGGKAFGTGAGWGGVSVRLEGNCFGKAGEQAIRTAVKGSALFDSLLF
jgi:hypothetical protein